MKPFSLRQGVRFARSITRRSRGIESLRRVSAAVNQGKEAYALTHGRLLHKSLWMEGGRAVGAGRHHFVRFDLLPRRSQEAFERLKPLGRIQRQAAAAGIKRGVISFGGSGGRAIFLRGGGKRKVPISDVLRPTVRYR